MDRKERESGDRGLVGCFEKGRAKNEKDRRGNGLHTVACIGKFVVGGVGAFLVCALRADFRCDSGRLQICDVCSWRIRVRAGGADIVDVEIGALAQRAFDVVVAGVVRGDAGGVCPRDGGAGLQRGQALLVVGV